MYIKEIKERKKNLEGIIEHEVTKFYNLTGIKVTDIQIITVEIEDGEGGVTTINTEVKCMCEL